MVDLASRLLSRMPAYMLADLVDANYTRLHIDPAHRFPTELMQQIYSHLSPRDVTRCARTSHAWRAATLANTRWRDLFHDEGWLTDEKTLRHLISTEEARRKDQNRLIFRKQSSSQDGSVSKRRRSADCRSNAIVADTSEWNEQHTQIEADVDGRDSDYVRPSLPYRPESQHEPRASTLNISPPSPLFQTSEQTPRLDWSHLYKQRHRLEKNWQAGRYVTLRLPTTQYPSDGHTDCVYTIQYTGNYLVSGSRDKTIKVWDLSNSPTQYRCIRTLDNAHVSSVLCLQFDVADDVIISGGSDSFLVIWRFSTGEVIRKMTDAHRESILNLRFDSRYLITCSKDKTIKIWNRHSVTSKDPIVPAASVNIFSSNVPDYIPAYTLLGTLEGHTAAVNAVQLYGDSIVSASGDRMIKLWDINTLTPVREFLSHHKGIACLQFDGRRIVSGSSDKTVRIFDVATAAQVACLEGHGDLVRTVQARFGDQNKSNEMLAAEAKAADEARIAYLEQHPEDTDRYKELAMGARIPLGGGGNEWSRIVSGSYDESICIWKADGKGGWAPALCLSLEQILQRAHREQTAIEAQVRQVAGRAQVEALHRRAQATLISPAQDHTSAAGAAATAANMLDGHNFHASQGRPAPATNNHGTASTAAPALQSGTLTGADHRGAPWATAGQAHIIDHGPQPHRHTDFHEVRHARTARLLREAEESKRLLKLQFDCRRIIACSQNRMIVGWDFANGDRELEEAAMCFSESM